jgi:hypothetical protein
MTMASKCQSLDCDELVATSSSGRPRRFCSDACRVEASRGRTKSTHGRRLRGNTGVRVSEQNSIDISTSCEQQKHDNPVLLEPALKWVLVNSVTWKLTDGEGWRTPACHGKWPGFNTERGVAWAMDTGWAFGKSAWFARCGDKSFGPTADAETAKQAAMAFAKGATSFPAQGLATSFSGPVNLNANPWAVAEMNSTNQKGTEHVYETSS